MDVVKKEFDVDIPIEGQKWNVGLIVGASGTGKTTIAKSVFKDFTFFDGFEWSGNSIIDDFGDNHSAKNITEVLSKVGFASPPDWLKPFAVLSNGQKMRAELARLILDCDKPFIYDEFTSVVDRQVACVGSAAIQKFVRKQNKQFVAVSCHYDIEEWLEPDWVYDCNKMEFSRRLLRRPKIECSIRKATQQEWREFMDFHYLSHNHNNAAHKYVCEINGESVAWCSVLHFPHPYIKNMKRIHRIVVKPDYQGIGIGSKFMSEIASKYKSQKLRITLVTSSPAFIHGLQANKNWVMTRKPSRLPITSKTGALAGSTSDARLTASFEYTNGKTFAEVLNG
jgi:ABC-type polar amino acid transport system ATPase subunit/GNAT superfamily N-acetyltransferase